MKLKSLRGVVGIYATTCKAWRCVSCSRKKKALIVDRLEYGMKLISGRLYFITLTFKTEGHSRRSADSVERAYRRWCELMRSRWPNLRWFKTVEWTKKNQAHLHLIVGGLPKLRKSEWTCITATELRGKQLKAQCRQENACLDHLVSWMWWASTKDSFVVYCEGVVGPRGAANYISKYVTKEVINWERKARAGFKRRWSCSQNWPRYEKLELAATTQEGWDSAVFTPYNQTSRAEKEYYPEGDPEDPGFIRVGNDRAIEFANLIQARNIARQARKIKNASKYETERLIRGVGQ